MLTGDFLGENPILNVSDFIVTPRRHSYASYEDIDGKRSTVTDIKMMLSKPVSLNYRLLITQLHENPCPFIFHLQYVIKIVLDKVLLPLFS